MQLFRTDNPFTALLLLIYLLVIKFYFLLYPAMPAVHDTDGWLYHELLYFLNNIFNHHAIFFALLALLLLFIQAMVINRVANSFRLLPKATYLPAMSFLLMSSFFKEWNIFSATLLINTLLIAALTGMIRLYVLRNVRDLVFNTGLLLGVAALFYFPAIIFLLLLWIALLINRPFHLAEWLIGILGIICPFYLAGTYLFITNHLDEFLKFPKWGWSFPLWEHAPLAIIAAAIIILFFTCGAWRWQKNFYKLLIQVRKIWMLLLAYALIAVLGAFANHSFFVDSWLLALIPLCVFMANAWWNIKKNWLITTLHLATIAFVWIVAFNG